MDDSSVGRVRFGNFELDRRSGELLKGGSRLRLQEAPLQVLEALIDRRGEIVTREELKRKLWPADTFVDFDNGLNTAVNRLRSSLGDPESRAERRAHGRQRLCTHLALLVGGRVQRSCVLCLARGTAVQSIV